MKNRNHHSCRAVLGVLLITAACLCRSQATTLLVYNTNNSGAGSLRQAITDNNAGSGGNTIIFSNVVAGTITLITGELLITKPVTILGPGANVLAVNGNFPTTPNRVFHIAPSNTVAISGLTITNGNAVIGGGIYNDHGTLTVSACVLTGNSATSYSGGGIANDGSGGSAALTVSACVLRGNSAGLFGGGIYNGGGSGSATLTVSSCTLSGNSAGFNGGGIDNDGDSGSAALTVIASTLSGNSAFNGGGILNNGNNGGSATLEIGNTVLKAGASGPNIYNSLGTVTSLGYNLSSDNGVVNANGGTGSLTALGDRTVTEPMLGPLQDNGGPTPTMMPLPGSPAIDQGKNLSGLATDQRGRCRTYDDPGILNAIGGDGSDIGAVEINPAHGAPLVTTNADGSVPGTLRYCICDALPTETVTFASAVTGTVTLTRGELPIRQSATIVGPGAKVLSVNGNHASRVFHIYPGATIAISGLTITNGFATGTFPASYGGGIFNDHSTLTLTACTLSGNSASDVGGGISSYGETSGSATLTLNACTLSGNSARVAGGIYNAGFGPGSATLTVSNCTLSGNSSSTSGGGIINDGSGDSATLTVIACTLSGNSAGTSDGGGIYNYFGRLSIGDTILKAGASGGNISNYNPSGTIISSGYNLSSDNGGGVLTNTTDQINTDPLLGPLADNGGPTFTHALLVGSPAIDKGKSFGLTTDQRGAPRPFDFSAISNASGGDGSDIGAFELGRPNLNITRAPPNVVVSWPGYYGDFMLQQNSNGIASVNWSNAPGTIQDDGTIKYLLVNPPAGNSFYRLFKP